MMESDRLLDLLEAGNGERVSGAELSQRLGVSRSAVWKRIDKLREAGYLIEGTPRHGYLLNGKPDLLYPRELRQGLATTSLGRKIHYYHSTGSTNQIALELARKGAPQGTVVVAEEQTAGRGRWRRQWFSPPAAGIWLSLILRPALETYLLPRLTLVAGAAVAAAIDQSCEKRPGLKWPNDLIYDGKKVGGILVELEGAAEEVNFLVVGIGINVNQVEEDFPPELRKLATSLRIVTGHPVGRLPLVRRLLEVFEKDYDRFCRQGLDGVREEWLSYQATLGKRIELVLGAEHYLGTAVGLNPDGSLAVRLNNGQKRSFNAGEITFCHQLRDGSD